MPSWLDRWIDGLPWGGHADDFDRWECELDRELERTDNRQEGI